MINPPQNNWVYGIPQNLYVMGSSIYGINICPFKSEEKDND